MDKESAYKEGGPASPGRKRAGGIADRHMRWVFLAKERAGRRSGTNSAESPCGTARTSLLFSEQALRITGQQQAGAAHCLLASLRHCLLHPPRLHRQAQPLRTPSMVVTIAGLANRRSWSMFRPTQLRRTASTTRNPGPGTLTPGRRLGCGSGVGRVREDRSVPAVRRVATSPHRAARQCEHRKSSLRKERHSPIAPMRSTRPGRQADGEQGNGRIGESHSTGDAPCSGPLGGGRAA